jgi:iron complex outermembrane recepter protein
MENKKLLTLAVAAAISATGVNTAIAQQSSDSESASAPALEEVIVTALRKEQNIQDVPMTVTAITPQAVFDNAIFRFEDIGQLAPGLFLSNPGGGFGSIAQLRGVGFDSQASASPAVDIYINDTPVDANYAFQSIYDIGQIEVLRGPQGTLRGRPAPAGAITMTTARPDLEGLGGAITGTASDQDARNVDGMVNVPIIDDELALRVAGLHNENDGGQVQSVGPDGNENTTTESWRASLRWAPTDAIDTTLTHQWLKGDQDSLAEVEGYGAGYNGPQIGSQQGLAVQEMPNAGTLHFQLTTLQASWEVAENHRLVYTGAHQDNDFELTRDLDIYNGVTGYVQESNVESTYKVDTQELRLESTTPDQFMDYLVGLWYQNDNTESTFAQPAPQSGAFGDPSSPSPIGAPDPAYIVFADGTIPTHSENIAIYSNTVMHLQEQTDLSLGVRYLQNKADRGETINSSDALIDVPIAPGVVFDCNSLVAFAPFTGNQRFPGYCELALPAGSSTKSKSDTENAWVYSASLQHNFTDEMMGYFAYGHSWRPAGVTVGITAPVSEDLIEGDPEESDSYELGVKSMWLEGRVRANADIFYQTFDNFIGRFEDVPYLGPGPSVQSGGFTYPGDATVQGFETDVTADVTDNWWVQVSTAYADGTYDDATVPCRDTDKDGNPDIGDIGNIGTGDFGDNSVFYCNVDTAISSTPLWVANLQSEYTFPLFSGEGYVRGLFNYYAKQQDTGGFRPDPYSVLNLYVGMRGPDNQWDVGLWTKNVFDENNQLVQGENQTVFGAFQSGYHQVGYVPEREIGLTVRYLFGNG